MTETIKDLKVCKTDPANVVNPVVNFTQTITAGRHMTCGRYFGDNILWIVYNDEPSHNITYSHTYPSQVGRYDFVLRCYNFLDYFIFIMNEVLVVESLEEPTMNLTNPTLVNHTWSEELSISFSFANGTNATCTAIFDGSQDNNNLAYYPAESGISYGTFSKSPASLSVGTHTLNISCSNLLGSYDFSQITIIVEKKISSLTLMAVDSYLTQPQTFKFFANTTEGTNLNYFFDFGNSFSTSTSMTQNQGPFQKDVTYQYASTGYYYVTVIVSNRISRAEAVIMVGVENPVTEQIVLSCIGKPRPDFQVECKVELPGGTPTPKTPTSTMAVWDLYSNGTIYLEENMIVAVGQQYDAKLKYSTYGDFNATVTVSNNVSSVSKSVPIRVGVAIENFYCETVNGDKIEIGKQMQFNCHVDKGSVVVYRTDYGENNVMVYDTGRTSTSDWTVLDNTIITYTYNNPGYVIANFTGENIFGKFYSSVPFFVFEQVQGLTLMALETHLKPQEEFTFFANITKGSKVEFEFDFKDGSANETKVMDQTTGEFKQPITHKYSQNDYFTVGVTARNNVSFQIAFFAIGVEYPVSINIILTATDVTRPSETVTFTITHPNPSTPDPDSTQASWDHNMIGTDDLVEFMTLGNGNPYINTFTYDRYGDLQATVTISNNVSSVTKTVSFRIGVALQGLTAKEMNPPHEVNKEMTFTCRIAQGSTVVYVVDPGDSSGLITQPRTEKLHWDQPDNTSIAHTYTTAGRYSVKFDATNNTFVPLISISVDITVYAPVQGVMLNSSHQYAKVGEVVTWTVSISQGTLVSSTVDFGDGSAEPAEKSHGFLPNDKPVKFTYDYKQPGNHSGYAYSKSELTQNRVASDGFLYLASEKISEIIVQEEVTSLKLSAVETIVKVPNGKVDYNVENTGTKKPTDLFCVWTYPDGTSDWSFAGELKTDLTAKHSHSHTFPTDFVGTHLTKVNCSNFVSWAVAELSIVFQLEVQNPVAVGVDDKVKVNEPCLFNVFDTHGSHLQYAINYKDGNQETKVAADENKLNGSFPFEITHTFTTSGNYSVDVKVFNDVSEKTVSLTIFVQQPVTKDSLTIVANGDKPVKYPPGDLTYVITPKPPGPYPDNVFISWGFAIHDNDYSAQPDFAQSLTRGNTFSKQHTFQNPTLSSFQTIVNASNLVSFVQIAVDVEIMQEIVGFKLMMQGVENLMVLETGATAKINASVEAGSKVTYTLNTDDSSGTPSLTKDTLNVLYHIFEYTYNTAKNYTVTGQASNQVSSSDYTLGKVIVQNKMTKQETKVTCDKYIKMDRANTNKGEMKVVIDSTASLLPTQVTFQVTSDDVEVGSGYVTSWSSFTHKYNYDYSADLNTNPLVSIKMKNLVSNITESCQPQIQEELIGLAAQVPEILTVNEIAKINVTLTHGSYFTVTADYGDTAVTSVSYNASLKFVGLEHNYTKAGVYNVKVTVQNDVTDSPLVVEGKSIKVMNPIPELEIKAVKVTPISSTDQFVLTVDKKDSSSAYPTEASIEVDFGDGSSPVIETGVLSTTAYVKSHSYSTNGTYSVMVTVKNSVSQRRYNHSVTAEKQITGLKVRVQDSKTGLQYDINDFIPAGSELLFQAEISEGTSASIKWSVDVLSFTTWTFKHSFTIPNDQYVLKVEVFNALGSVNFTRPLKVVSANGIRRFDYNTTIIVNQYVDFEVQIKDPTNDICFELFLNATNPTSNPSTRHWFGPSKQRCIDSTTSSGFQDSAFSLVSDSSTFIYSHKMGEEGFYTVSLVMLTPSIPVLTTDPTKTIEVQGKPCFNPVIEILDQNSDPNAGKINNPIQFKKADAITAPKKGINIKIDCQATDQIVSHWQMYKVLAGGQEQKVAYNDSQYGGIQYQDRIEFGKNKMPYGKFKFVIKTQMKGYPDKSGSAEFYIEILASQLKLDLTDSQRIGYGELFQISATANDPDIGSADGILYEWFCSQETEGLTQEYLANNTTPLKTIVVPDGSEYWLYILLLTVGI